MFWLDAGTTHAQVLSFRHLPGGGIYLDVAGGVITFLLAGRYIEARWKRFSGNALRSLVAIGAKTVNIVDSNGAERTMPVAHLEVGDRFVVRPGDTIAADGEVESGRCAVDRSAMTGESVPVEVGPDAQVIGGTVATDGRLVVRATSVGRDTQLAHMVRLVEDAQSQKAAVQRTADRISAYFVPSVVAIAGLTLAGWLAAGASTGRSFTAALSVLIIACPCALGLATPAALLVASGQGARFGIFFKGYRALEASRQIDTVVLDKTGTLTEGTMTVVDVAMAPGVTRAEVLALAGAVEQASEHPIAAAVAEMARNELGAVAEVKDFFALHGLGAQGVVDDHVVTVGRDLLLGNEEERLDGLAHRRNEWERAGFTAIVVGQDGKEIGALAIADVARPSAPVAVAQLKTLGLHCVLLTGDNEQTACSVGDAVGIDDIVSGALPDDKVAVIRRLQSEGHAVAMVGDGVNDAPALVAANLGLAVGSGTDVAVNAADLIVVRDDLRVVAQAIDLSRRTLRTIHGNLIWALAYNVAAIPLAACGLLNPLIAGAAMAVSSLFVVYNSSRLRRVRLLPTPNFKHSTAGTLGESGILDRNDLALTN
jgi:heavy metal translocating P-type ATPase